MELTKKLAEIQQKLKAPKNQYNSFGKYKYRSCEDILEGLKPLLGELVLIVTDEMVEVGGRIYVCATAEISCGEDRALARGWAREPDQKKGMDQSQVTGAASSYARKYALNGLFCIDDTKDADSNDNTGNSQKPKQDQKPRTMKDVFTEALVKAGHTDPSKFCEMAGLTVEEYRGLSESAMEEYATALNQGQYHV